jgi:phosphatidylinositol alpha 1,6-mannosyltransferase
VRVAIVTESFLPTANGVTTSVCRVLECLRDAGHEAVVVAPRPAPAHWAGHPVRTVASVPVRQFPVGLPTTELEEALADAAPDVVHVASPFVLGARGLAAAQRLGLPTVAVYQTDMPSYLAQHSPLGLGRQASQAAWRWVRRLHGLADLTLAPSSAALHDLRSHGIPRTALWGRGVDTTLFHPGWRHDAGTRALRRTLAPDGEVLLGYVGRLAPEKELHRLAELAHVPGTRLVLVGDGPDRAEVGALLADAVAESPGRPNRPPVFLGRRDGDDLARAYAALDVFVHTGTRETFGQTLQEAAASGLPVVAPARGGPLDLVRPGTTGHLFDPGEPGSLAEATRPLVGDAVLRSQLGAAGRAAVAHRSWAALTDELVGHYAAVLAGGAARAAA